MRNSFSKMYYPLIALLMFALAGCGANSATVGQKANTQKLTAKVVGLQIDNVTKVRLKVTGATIPTATQDFAKATEPKTIEVYPGSQLIVTALALDNTGKVLFEGFATNVTVTPGTPAEVSIQLTQPFDKPTDTNCIACHDTTRDATGQNLVADYKQSGHYKNTTWTISPAFNGATQAGCAGCHGTQHNDLNPAASGRCNTCHDPLNMFPSHKGNGTAIQVNNCNSCHQSHNTTAFVKGNCIACHSVPQNAGAGYVQDNSGVRSITQEFGKWSHHVTGVALNDAHCAACHLEGTVKNGQVMLDNTKHMVDAKTHLRNADTDVPFDWDPAAPNHSGMDTYCMSCHDANGAVSPGSVLIQKFINDNGLAAPGKTASATNPFGDTISNRYDKMQRPAVVDASGQFDVTNNSHHAVKGKRYSGRTRAAGARQIDSPATFANNSSALLQGERKTIYDAGNFNALYVPLGTDAATVATTGLGDDSTLHCGDCHTVGQWKAGVATNAAGVLNTVAIGAHGSNNEYLLRNSIGTDQRHTQSAYTVATGIVTYTNPNGAYLVCFNCHTFNKYGSAFNVSGSGHAGEYDSASRCNGSGNTLAFNGYTTGTATDGTQFESRIEGNITVVSSAASYAGEQNSNFRNVFGIQCANCHNSGTGNAYGGIHGSKNNQNSTTANTDSSVTGGAYIDGMGNTTKIERFLPGLGNVMHVPGTLGGITNGISSDTNWEQKVWNQSATSVITTVGTLSSTTNTAAVGAGCYTLGAPGDGAATDAVQGPSVTGAGGAATALFGTWGGCDDHGAAPGAGDHGFTKKVVRPVTY